jgi:hypothetical protein
MSDQPIPEAATSATHNQHKRRPSMPSSAFEPTIPAINRPQTYATGIGIMKGLRVYSLQLHHQLLLYFRYFTITLKHTTLGRTPVDEGPARRRDLYLTKHNTHKRQTSMPPAGFEPKIPASEWPQTHALDD